MQIKQDNLDFRRHHEAHDQDYKLMAVLGFGNLVQHLLFFLIHISKDLKEVNFLPFLVFVNHLIVQVLLQVILIVLKD